MRTWQWLWLLLVWMPTTLTAQSEAESSNGALDVHPHRGKDRIKHTFFVGDRVGVVAHEPAQKVHGRITAIQDSSIAIAYQVIPLQAIRSIKGPSDSMPFWMGNLMLLLSLGAGFGGWIFLRAMLRKSPNNGWQWTLVVLGLLLAIVLMPILLLATMFFWAFASHKFLMGKENYFQVRR